MKDLALPANDMPADFTWTFTTAAATEVALRPCPCSRRRPFGDFGGSAGMTNMGILTVINGDIGTIATANSTITGFHDVPAISIPRQGRTMGAVNGTIFSCTNSSTGPNSEGPSVPNCNIATQARLDAQTAYLALAPCPGRKSPAAIWRRRPSLRAFIPHPMEHSWIQGGDLTLDAQGNANAVFVFQMATSLTVGGPGADFPQNIILTGNAQAKNVFWQVGSFATINAAGGGTMVEPLFPRQEPPSRLREMSRSCS